MDFYIKKTSDKSIGKFKKQKDTFLATQGFEPRTSGLWAQHANRCAMLL